MSSSPPPTSSPAPTSPSPPATLVAPPPSNSTTPPPQPAPFPPPPAGTSPPPSSSSPPPPDSTPSSPAPPGNPSPSGLPPPGGSSGSGGEPPPYGDSSPAPSNSVSTGLVVGLSVGGVLLLLVLGITCFCCFRKKRRPQPFPSPPPPPHHYYCAPPPPPPPPPLPPVKGQTYAKHQNWNNVPPPIDHVIKIPPNPPPPPPFAQRPPHPPAPLVFPPPPPVMSNSGGSGSSYSGSENQPLPLSSNMALGFSKSTFTYDELAMATDGFSDANLLGQGGFGYVHRGVLPNGKEVAVKQLKSGSGQGEREFQAEVEIISRVHHRHLVSLVGYCIADGKRLLVYEFVPNNTLEFHLHGSGQPILDWPTRLKIALGSGKGLAYLHEDCHPRIIHRDIKASNILLDLKFEAKVADFGLAKIASETNTHVSTRVMGTFGYLAPEYASSGKLTDKSDVFSFGVMLLELITGRRPYDPNQSFMDDSLVDWARPLLTRALDDGNFDALVDPRLGSNYNPTEMKCMIACAAAAVRHSAKRRPKMSQIVRALEGDASLEHLNEGVKPGHSSVYGSYGSSDYDAMQYNEDMKKFRKMALGSQECSGSGYSVPTSEYGQNPSASRSDGQQTQEMEMGSLKKDSQGFTAGS